MKELSLHMLDIAQNSIAAGAGHMDLAVEETGGRIILTAADDGRGMPPELLATVADPFTTTRTTRKVGLGLPLLRMAAEMTGGHMDIESTLGVGTTVTAVFHAGHIDCPPLEMWPPPYPCWPRACRSIWILLTSTGPGGESSALTRRRSALYWGRRCLSRSRRWPGG